MSVAAAACSALALCASAATDAQPVTTPAATGVRPYLEVHVGEYRPTSDDLAAIDFGIDLGATVGVRLGPYAAIEGELSYVDASGAGPGPSVAGYPTDYDQHLQMMPVTASLRLLAPTHVAEFSVVGGAGWYFTRLRSTEDVAHFGASPRTRSASDSPTGFHAGAAVAFRLSPHTRVGAEARYTWAIGNFTGEFDTVPFRLNGLRVAATLGYRF